MVAYNIFRKGTILYMYIIQSVTSASSRKLFGSVVRAWDLYRCHPGSIH